MMSGEWGSGEIIISEAPRMPHSLKGVGSMIGRSQSASQKAKLEIQIDWGGVQ